jgi:DNA-binding transcriptional regulator GbsR (MarR family)
MKLVTHIIIVLMVMSLLSTGILAASAEGNAGNNGMGNQGNGAKNQGEGQDLVFVSVGDETEKNSVTVRSRDNREEYFAAKQRLQQLNGNIHSGKIIAASKEVFEVRQDYLLATIDYTIANLEELKEKVDASQREDSAVIRNDIDAHIVKLDAEKGNLQNATTTGELARSARNIRDIWRDAVKDAYITRTKFVDDKVGVYLDKSVSLAERLAKEIEALEKQGVDTGKLEELLAEYNALLEQARQNRELAREADQNVDARSREYWGSSAANLKEANFVLEDISRILRTYRQGVVTLNEDGMLVAGGNGTAVLSGNIETEMNITNAQLVIKDYTGDAKVQIITSDSEIVLELDNALADDPKGALVYSDLTGKVTISGSRLTVMVKGNNLDLSAEGIGNVVLSGEGTYTTRTDEYRKYWVSGFDSGSEEYSSQEE